MSYFGTVDTEKFIQFYIAQECLWNIKHLLYSKREHRMAAIKMIAQQMSSHGREMTVEQVTAKIASLRTYYGRELKKVNQSEKSGAGVADVYSSTWEFFPLLDPFLRPHVQQRPSTTNMTREPDTCSEKAATASSSTAPDDTPGEQEISNDVQAEIVPPQPKQQKITSEKLQSLMFSTLQNIGQRKTEKKENDTDVLFGQQVGLELKKVVNQRKRQELKLKINQLIFDYQFDES